MKKVLVLLAISAFTVLACTQEENQDFEVDASNPCDIINYPCPNNPEINCTKLRNPRACNESQ